MSASQFKELLANDASTSLAPFSALFSTPINGLTPLQFSAKSNSPNCVSFFLSQVRIRAPGGRTALILAVESNSIPCVKILAKHESRMTVKGVSALEMAAQAGYLEVCEILIGFEPEKAKNAYYLAKVRGFNAICNLIQQSALGVKIGSGKLNSSVDLVEESEKMSFGSDFEEERAEMVQIEDPSEVLTEEVIRVNNELDALKIEFKTAVSLSQKYQAENELVLAEKAQIQKKMSCLKVENRKYIEKFDQQQRELNLNIINNDDMRRSVVELQKQINSLQHTISFQQDEYYNQLSKKQNQIQKLQASNNQQFLSNEQLNSKVEQITILADEQIQSCQQWKSKCFDYEASLSYFNINQSQSEQKNVGLKDEIQKYKQETELNQKEIQELKKLLSAEQQRQQIEKEFDLDYLIQKLETKVEGKFLPLVLKLKEKLLL